MPTITAPAITTVPTTGPVTTPALDGRPVDLFASLLTALTSTPGTTVVAAPIVDTPTLDTPTLDTPVPDLSDHPDLSDLPDLSDHPDLSDLPDLPVVDPTALVAAALSTATVVPAPLADVPAAPAVEQGLHVRSPGQAKAPGTSAKDLAPGHLKVEGASAKDFAPGQLSRATEVPVATGEIPVVTPVAQAAAPIAPISEPAPIESTHTVRPAIAAAAKRLTHEGDRTSLVVRLDPPELGAVLVRLTVREGHVEVTLRAPDLAAQGSLLAQAPEIEQVLRDAGLDLTSFDVSYGELTQGESRERRETPNRGTPQQRSSADGTVHVTDDVTDPQPAGTWL